jgi:hypothetical protein
MCPSCQAANPAGTLFCVACSRPLGAPAPVAVVAAARGVRLVAIENLQPTGLALSLPDTGYAGTLLLGRADLAAGVVVDVDLAEAGRQRGVSRRHATLRYGAGVVHVADWQSAHGTWLNKARLAAGQELPLADGDELRLAEYVFRVELR